MLSRTRHVVGPNTLLVVGTDPSSDPAVLLPNARRLPGSNPGAFNMNLLIRIHLELGAISLKMPVEN